MNTNSKIKNIFINLVLALSMVLSIIGSAFLLKPYTRRVDAADAQSSTLPNGLKFTASKSKAQVNDYNENDGFVYTGSQLNYISADNLLYFYDIKSGRLYTDSNYSTPAQDVTYSYDSSNKELSITKKGDSSTDKYKIKNNIYVVEYDGRRYYLNYGSEDVNKNGVLYNDVACTDSGTNLSYEIEYMVDTYGQAPISEEYATTKLKKSKVTFSSEEIYYEIIRSGSSDPTKYYIKNGDLKNIYFAGTGEKENLVDSYPFDLDIAKPYKIHFYSTSMIPSIENTINNYLTINDTKYYIYNNELYNSPVFKSITLPNEFIYSTISSDTISVDGQIYNPVTINGTIYYVITSDSNNKLYFYNAEDNTVSEVDTTSINFKVSEITDNTVITQLKDIYPDNLEQSRGVGEITVTYYFKEKSFTLSSDTFYAANINGSEYYFLRNDPQKRVFNNLGANITSSVPFTVTEFVPEVENENKGAVKITFSLNGSTQLSFKRYGNYELSEEKIINNGSDDITYNKVLIEGTYYYVIKNDASKTLYTFTAEGEGGTMNAVPRVDGDVNNVYNQFTITEITDSEVVVKQKEYFYIGQATNTLLCIKTEATPLSGTEYGDNIYEINGNYYTFYENYARKISTINLFTHSEFGLSDIWTTTSSFISYKQNYYYYDGKVYTTPIKPSTPEVDKANYEVKDFEYESTLSRVLLNNVYYDIHNVEYQYVELFGQQYYVYNGELYSFVTIGGKNLLNFKNKVNNTNFAYKIDTFNNFVSTFNASSGNEITFEDKEVNSINTIGTVENGDDSYYISEDLKLYSVNGFIPYESLNINYNIEFDATKTFNENTIITINGRNIQYDSETDLEFLSHANYQEDTFHIVNEGKNVLIIDYHRNVYVFFLTNTGNENTLYYHNSSIADITDTPSANDIPVIVSVLNTEEFGFSSESLTNYLVVGLDLTSSPKTGTVLFNSVSENIFYDEAEKLVNVNGKNYSVDETTGKLTSVEYGLEATFENFLYNIPGDNSRVNVVNRFLINDSNFEKVEGSEVKNYSTQYIHAPKEEGKEPVYLIVGKYDTANTDIISVYIDINFNHFRELSSNELLTTDAIVNATYVTIKYQELTPYEVQSYISASYVEHETFSDSTKFGNNSIVMLDNYLTKSAFIKGEVGSTGEEIDVVYLGFGEKLTVNPNETPTSNTGIISLNVSGFLKNEYVMKYLTTASSYTSNYGIALNISAPITENVLYSSQSSNNVNNYWYQRLNLTKLMANIDYNTSDGANSGSSTGILTEEITETSGLYTFVFDYTFIDGKNTTEGTYIFSFYLSENSDYIEYPMFNTKLNENTSKDLPSTYDQYYTIVNDVTSTSNANMTFAYNNQTFDKPTYIYDATKFNVSYDYKYNIEAHNYTTNFVVKNSGLSNEYGYLELFRDSTLFKTYRINSKKYPSTASDVRIANSIAIDYYLDENQTQLYGSLFITSDGNYYLSLENYYYYNQNNRSFYADEADYYTNGRLIKNGATNTPLSYYMVFMFEDLGDYTFTNKYLIAEGNHGNDNTNYYKIVDNGVSTKDTLQGKYSFISKSGGGYEITLTSGAISRFAHYTEDGDYVLPNLADLVKNPAYSSGSSEPESLGTDSGLDSNLIPYYSTTNSNPTLKIFGITTTFNKPVNGKSQETSFKKIDENVFSDITPKTTFKNNENEDVVIDQLIGEGTYAGTEYTGTLKFYNNADYKYHVPLTNLQPIYFRYFGDFDYDNSYYYRFQKCDYTIDENGMLQGVNFANAERSKVNFTNKTSISSSGFYIVVVAYSATDSTGTSITQYQYFMFAIDNSAPNLKIFTQNKVDGSDKQLFISSTEFSQTSRYTNKNKLSATWNTPNYFQGEINVSYIFSNYDETRVNSPVNYTKDTTIDTENGRYTFTINYGVNGISSTSTYVIVDKTTPTGELFKTYYYESGDSYILGDKTENRIFNSPVTFASPTHKLASGAKITARITTITLNSYDNYATVIDNLNAITTDIEIDATNSLFNDNLDTSPIYNYYDPNNPEYLEMDGEDYGPIVKKSQLLGLSDEATIYIVKLYDEAGNYEINYFIYDNSLPYILYRVANDSPENYVTSFENNTTQANTEIIWNNYKAIHIKDDGTTRTLFEGLKSAITADAYNGIFIKEVNGEYYLYVPINYAQLTSSVMENNVNKNYTAKTVSTSNNYAKKATIFIDTTDTKTEPNAITDANPKISFMINAEDGSTLKNYSEFFKGNKAYNIQISDAVGNNLNKRIFLNSSFAQETFFGYRASGSTAYNLSAYNAYNVARLTTQYKNLMDSQSFYAKISYDYYNISFENYLRESEDASIDDSLTSYSTFGYDLENYIVYMFDSSSGQFVERGAYNKDTQKYDYKYNDYNVDDPDSDHFYTYEELTEISNGKFYLPGYPYVLSYSDVLVNTTQDNSGSTPLCVSNTIYEEGKATKEGLYIFKRSYVDIASGTEITQEQIASGAEELKVLENDRAIRYYVFYVDRKGIIELTYDATGIVDIINSIGNLLEINLGEDRNGDPDPVINAEVLNSSGTDLEITTNKLKVLTDFTLDKYATTEKLTSLRKYGYIDDANLTINEIGEDLSTQRNVGTFKYYISINNGFKDIVKDNVILDAKEVKDKENNFVMWVGQQYTLTITDNSYLYDNNTGEKVENSANQKVFRFRITHSSPEGTFITMVGESKSIKELPVREEFIDGDGTIKTFVSSNADNLSFTFSDSDSKYDATIDPYSIKVYSVPYESQNSQGLELFSSNYSKNIEYYNTFSGSLINGVANNTNLPYILQIFDRDGNDIKAMRVDHGAPYTYRINIFDKSLETVNDDGSITTPLPALSKDDRVYIVEVNYVGDNSDGDYIIDGSNYFKTTFKIHIDRVAPQENLKNLISKDTNLDLYCTSIYGSGYANLTNEQKQQVLTTYAFPVRYILEENIEHYYAKKYNGSSYNSISNYEDKNEARLEILDDYSTIFYQDHDDSERLFVMSVGTDVAEYKHSVLPTEDGYNDGGSYNGHERFSEGKPDVYIQFDYSLQVAGKFYFSDYTTQPEDNSLYFDNAYYEIIEQDEAGNLTRYLVYATDNTDVQIDFKYVNSDSDNVDTDKDGRIDTSYYFIHDDVKYYIKDGVVGEKIGDAFKAVEKEYTINYQKYYHNYGSGDGFKFVEDIPVSVDFEGNTYELIGSKKIDQSYTNSAPFKVLNLAGMHFIKEAPEGAESLTYSYLFDDFFSVRIYYRREGLQNETLYKTYSSNPYEENYSTDKFLNSITNEFRNLVAGFEESKTKVYNYRIEIINRFGYSNYNLSLNLPNGKLEPIIPQTATNDTLVVTIPSSGDNDYVKIITFNAYIYEDKQWKLMTRDSSGKDIITENPTNRDAGLEATTYTFTTGQYKFVSYDNFNRGNNNGLGEYRIVGGNIDSTYSITYSRPHIVQEDDVVITSGTMSLLINDTIWQIRVALKNAVKVTKIADNSTQYYTLISEGETTKLYKYVDGINDIQIYFKDNLFIEGFSNGALPVYYFRGKLYSNTQYKTPIQLVEDYTYEVVPNTTSQYIYSPGNTVEDKRYFTMNAVCEHNIGEYEIRINWTTDPSKYTFIKLKIDRNLPKLILLNESGALSAVENQNYNKPFTISWESDYSTTATLIRTIDSISEVIRLNASDNFEINKIAGYTLTIIDEIGNQVIFNFNFVENANEYFSVLVNEIEILPSSYVSTYGTSGKTIRYYYYDNTNNPTVSIKTDETKNIGKIASDGDSEYDYQIIRTNINYTICYVKLIPVTPTSLMSDFIEGITFTKKDGTTENFAAKIDPLNPNFEITYMKNQDYDSFTINAYKNLGGSANAKLIGDKIYVQHYYNNKLIRTYSSDTWAQLRADGTIEKETSTFAITLSSTGEHRFEFRDFIGNTTSSLTVTLIKDIIFTANNDNPIDNRFFNTDVVLDVPNTAYYNDVVITAKLNGVEINTDQLKQGNRYTFSSAGSYEVVMKAQNSEFETYESKYNFTIINKNVTKMTFGFSNSYGFTISKVLKNQADITELITSESKDSMWLTSGDKDAIGTYTITLLGYDKLSNTYLPFTFVVKLNNEIPSIISTNYTFGKKTTKPVTIQYNPAVIYSQVGESYIRITGDNGIDQRIEINADSVDEIATYTISTNGKYRVTIYNNDGIFIASYAVNKAAPLNTSAKIIIIVAVILTIALTITFIVLRRHTKFR